MMTAPSLHHLSREQTIWPTSLCQRLGSKWNSYCREGRIDWQTATWAQAKDALRLTYPVPDEAEQSAEILDDFTQTERTSQHAANWLRHREQEGTVIDLDNESLLLKKAYSSTLSDYLPPSCRRTSGIRYCGLAK